MENEIDNENENGKATAIFCPGVGGALSYGWQKMKANFLVFFLVVLVLSVVELPQYANSWRDIDSFDRDVQIHQNGPEIENNESTRVFNSGEGSIVSNGGNTFTIKTDHSVLYGLLKFLYLILLLPVFQYSGNYIFLQGVRGEKADIKNITKGFSCYLNVVLSSLLVFALIGIGLVLLIIPGIYIACRLAFVSFLVMDEGLDPIEAAEASWRITRGHAWKIFCLGVVSIFIWVFGLMLFIVGVFPATMWIYSSFASLYLSISQQGQSLSMGGDREQSAQKAKKWPIVLVIIIVIALVIVLVLNNVDFDRNTERRELVLDSAGIELLEVNASAGTLRIEGVDGLDDIQLTADIISFSDNVELSFKTDGEKAVLRAGASELTNVKNNKSPIIDLWLRVPTKLKLDIDDGSGALIIKGISGDININDGSGNIVIEDINGNIALNDGSGNITIARVDGTISLDDGSGNMRISEVSGLVTINDGSGNISLNKLRNGLIIDNAGSGNLRMNEVEGEISFD